LYSHGGGRVGVMVEVNCETDFVAKSEDFRKFAHEVALQIAAAAPQYVAEKDIPADVLAHEGEIAKKRAMEEGKPEAVAAKIVEGRLSKFKDEACLLRQVYIRDENVTIEKLMHEKIAALGENIVIRRFVRWELGEASQAAAE
jgi:elongation factor Ts